MHLAVHSRLLTFGRVAGGVATVFDVLKDAVGESGTLVFPTYTTRLGPDEAFDPMTTPSQMMGALPEYARRQPGVGRSSCPMHSHAAVGARARVVLEADETVSLGAGSSFEAMSGAGFQVLLLGCSFQEGATFVHHVEALVGVPYRRWLALPRKVRGGDGTVRDLTLRYYGRNDDAPANDFTPVERRAEAEGGARRVAVNARSSFLFACTSVERLVRSMLAIDSFALTERAQ
ncbi:MAG: AAC(3) family N-acetyltransferase [Alphaproteobacteria bacterium]|nr:AAC(3) family N-acetyltransferase [Alphaproteobacteria bacterium]